MRLHIEQLHDRRSVGRPVPVKSALLVGIEVIRRDDHQPEPMAGDLRLPSLVIEPALGGPCPCG